MKILIVHPSFRVYGGAELVIVRLIQELKKLGHRPHLLTETMCNEVKEELHEEDFTVLDDEGHELSDKIIRVSKLYRAIKKAQDA